jgi:hypothetical protein
VEEERKDGEKEEEAEEEKGRDMNHIPASPAALRRCRTGETVKVMVHSGLTARINRMAV